MKPAPGRERPPRRPGHVLEGREPRLRAAVAAAAFLAVLASWASCPALAGTGAGASPAALPEPDGIHPVTSTLEGLGPFSGGLAAVKWKGRWGYVDKAGKVVVPFLYDTATPFDGDRAAVKQGRSWRIIDKTGTAIPLPQPLARLSRFSEGLAAAKATSGGKWGYVGASGAFAIAPQFDRADAFSRGLAAVQQGGKWSYVRPTGSVALATPYYRAYSFSADGLALFQEKRDGPYGYLRTDGSVAIPASFVEARPFSEGLAPVRVGDKWGYVTATGAMALSPRFTEAFGFNAGLALVQDGLSLFYFVGPDGKRAHASSWAAAEAYSDRVAVVGDRKKLWYVDVAGARLPIGEAVLQGDSDGSTCASGVSQGVTTNYVNGIAFFQIVNQTSLTWNVTSNNTNPNGFPILASPGLPLLVDSTTGPKLGQYGFLYQYGSMVGWPTGVYPMLDLTLKSTTGGYSITLSNSNNYTAPPPPQGHPWWEFLAMAEEMMEGMFAVATGDYAIGVLDMLNASYDIASGTTDDKGSDNDNSKTNNTLQTTLSATVGTSTLEPLNGGFCGGDSYTVSDAENYVISLTTIKSQLMPPTIQLTIYPYSAYFAQNAIGKLDMFRKGNEPGGVKYLSPPQSCVYAVAMENWSDPTNDKPCQRPTAFPTYDYFTKASSFEPELALDWWSFTNNLGTNATQNEVQAWLRLFGGTCGTLPAECPNGAAMTATPSTFDVQSDGVSCPCKIYVQNPAHTVYTVGLPANWLANPGDCGQAKPPAGCTYLIEAQDGGTGTVTLSDGLTSIPIPITCKTPPMFVAPDRYSGSTFTAPCVFAVGVVLPAAPVTVSPSTYVTSNNCTQAKTPLCNIQFSLPAGTNQTMTLSDGVTSLPVAASCISPPMSLTPTSYAGTSFLAPCSTVVQVSRPRGPVTVSPSTYVTANTCTGATPGSCVVSLSIPAGTNQSIVFADGATTQALAASCTDPPMTAAPTSFTGSSFPAHCTFTTNVYRPHAKVTATPGGSVTSNTCTAATAGACTVSFVTDVGTTQSISLTDGTTTLPITSTCTITPMVTVPADKSQPQLFTWSGQASCALPVSVTAAHGTVTAGVYQSFVSSSTCVGTQDACSLTLNIPLKSEYYEISLTDGSTVSNLIAGCFVCPGGIYLPWGAKYPTSKDLGYKNTVLISCAQLPISVKSAPTGGTVDTSGCVPGKDCYATVTSPSGGRYALQDANGSKAYFDVSVGQ